MCRGTVRIQRSQVVSVSRVVAVTVLLLGSTALARVAGQVPSSNSPTTTILVDCTKGQSIMKALDTQGSRAGGPIVVVIRGTCNENVSVRRDWVTLQGESEGDGIAVSRGTAVLLWQVRKIGLEQLTITKIGGRGGSIGIYMVQQTTANMGNVRVNGFRTGLVVAGRSGSAIGDSTFEDNRTGISVSGNSGVTISDSLVDSNRIGITVTASASLVASRTSLQNSDQFGLFLNRGATVDLRDVRVAFNENHDIFLRASHLLLGNGSVVDWNNNGVGVTIGSSVQIGDARISDNTDRGVSVEDNSVAVFEEDQNEKSAIIELNKGLAGLYLSQSATAAFGSISNPVIIRNNSGAGIQCLFEARYFVRGPLPDVMGNNPNILGCPP